MKQWLYKDTSITKAELFAKEAGIGLIFAYLLLNRGIDSKEDSTKFIYPSISELHDPFLLADMKKGVERIRKAAAFGEKVTVFGDYDVDGLTSTAILTDTLSVIGINADSYIPDRIHEGYGLNNDAIKSIAKTGTRLIVTVDLGVTAISEVEYGNSLGIDFVITDHHQLSETLPDAYAVINPNRADCNYPYKHLAGVGVAFKLASALLSDRFDYKTIFSRYYDLLCLGTISDIVPLTGENRLYAKYGLKHFQNTQNPGLKALIKYSGYENRIINETAVGFGIGPRINCAGRMGNVEIAHKALTTKDAGEASSLASSLCEINEERKKVEQEVFEQAIKQIGESDIQNVIVVYGKGWHTGIIGIVASKILDLYYRPTVVLGIDDNGIAHGSARSVSGFNIFDAFSACSELLEKFGGHEMAAGLTLKEENIPVFSQAINHYSDIIASDELFIPSIEVDYEADPTEIDITLAEKIKYFEPFGTDNPCPVFALRDMSVIECGPTRDGKHLRLRGNCNGKHFWCIGFNMGNESIKPGDIIDLAFNLEINEYNNNRDVSLIIRDIHKH